MVVELKEFGHRRQAESAVQIQGTVGGTVHSR